MVTGVFLTPAAMRLQIAIGIALFALAVAAMMGAVPALLDLTYPLAWWGLLLAVDAWNYRLRGLSLWRGNAPLFWSIVLPASALLWLVFELMNLPAPQWIYIGGFHSIAGQTLLGFVAFGTVVPIVIEAWWLVRGEICLPRGLLDFAHRGRAIWIAAGALLLLLPWFNRGPWWLNQGMWLAPALLWLPFTHAPSCANPRRWLRDLTLAGLLSGVAWESLNWPSHTHWQYTILPHAPHLFQMPLPGYIGFIPFALTCLAAYELCLRLRTGFATAAMLYVPALGLMYVVTKVYFERGIWRP